MRATRICFQIVFLLLFFLFLTTPQIFTFLDFFFRGDLLTILSASVSSRIFTISIVFILILIIPTLFFGRIFCGWACPLGSIADMVDYIFGVNRKFEKARVIKYYILYFFVLTAVGGINLVWMVDPITWASRISGLFVFINTGLLVGFCFLIILVFIEFVFGSRGFCRLFCPLGAILAILSIFSFTKRNISNTCTHCKTCAKECKMAAIGSKPDQINKMECIQCKKCIELCDKQSIQFSYAKPGKFNELNISKRSWLSLLFTSITAFLYLYLDNKKSISTESIKLRPPGTTDNKRLGTLCIRCGSCVRICPTRGLSLDKTTLDPALWETPVLIPENGGCEYNCNACGVICPTGAIKKLPLAKKQRTMIGIAKINQNLCKPYSTGDPCMVCYSSCPTGAIFLNEKKELLPWGDKLQIPKINNNLCTGCGLCEASCPIEKSAIKITPLKV